MGVAWITTRNNTVVAYRYILCYYLKIILQLNLFFVIPVRGAIVMTPKHNHHVSVGSGFYKSSIILYQDKMKMRIIVCTLAIFSITAIEIKSRTTENWIVWKKSPPNIKWTENVIYWRHLAIYIEDSLIALYGYGGTRISL